MLVDGTYDGRETVGRGLDGSERGSQTYPQSFLDFHAEHASATWLADCD
jgi:hypothetical protein